MSYQYVRFNDVPLALFDHRQGHDPMPVESTLIDSIGGAFDWKGSEPRRGRKQDISATGTYVGETEYFVDETGDYLVDETGDFLIAGDGVQILQEQVSALVDEVGNAGQLWRERLYDGMLHWKTARFLAMPWPRVWEDHALRATISCRFQTDMSFWHAEDATTIAHDASDATAQPFAVDNPGEVIEDAILTITCIADTITDISITGDGIELEWTGTLDEWETLVIDCGNQEQQADAVDAYNGLTFGAGHTVAGWLPLASGLNILLVTVTGGDATVTLSYYEQFK